MPPEYADGLTLDDLCNEFLTERVAKREAGDLIEQEPSFTTCVVEKPCGLISVTGFATLMKNHVLGLLRSVLASSRRARWEACSIS